MRTDPPLLPPWWFVESWNAAEHRRGLPRVSALDPMVMLAWHLVSQPVLGTRRPLVLITGC